MYLHEYQAKAFLAPYGLSVPRGYLAYTPLEAQKAAQNLLPASRFAVKAQLHAGGRGKAGGVKLASSTEEVFEHASSIIGMRLISPQTGPEGRIVKKVYVEAAAEIEREFYFSISFDMATSGLSLVVSAQGGTEIEELAKTAPSEILTLSIPPGGALMPYHSRRVASFLGLDKAQSRSLAGVLDSLYRAFEGLDAELLEINPLILDKSGNFSCLDAKVGVDDNALYRQKALFEAIDYEELDPREIRAMELGLNYIALDGNIGCMVNGAGLAMATMDIIKQYGASPANFLDVGGAASRDMVREGFALILKNTLVRGILVNIFGGIVRCDVIAEGIIEAAKSLDISVPIVVRLLGTNVALGKDMLENSGLKFETADTMAEAAQKIVAAI